MIVDIPTHTLSYLLKKTRAQYHNYKLHVNKKIDESGSKSMSDKIDKLNELEDVYINLHNSLLNAGFICKNGNSINKQKEYIKNGKIEI